MRLAGDVELPVPGPGRERMKYSINQHLQHTDIRVYKVLFSGALAGGISRTATAPVDRLKMIMQVQDTSKRGLTLKEGMQRMAAEGSFRAYFKGNGANVVKIAPETAIKLTLNDTLKHVLARDPDNIRAVERMTAGGIAGAVAQFLLYPIDTIRTRLTLAPTGTYRGILHAAYRMHRDEGGMRAFYRGLVPSMCGILPYAGVDICLFEMFKMRILSKADEEGRSPSHVGLLAAGMVSSSLGQILSYPLALIRTRLQAQGVGGRGVKYTGMMDVGRKTVQREGVRGLYKGLLPNIIKLAPAAGISWYVFEECKMQLGVDPHS